MSSRPSYSLPSSSQLWVEAAASLNGVCSRDLHISAAPPSARYRRFHCCPDTCLRYADGATGGPVQCFTITRSWLHRTRRSARRPGRGAAGSSSVVDPETAAPVHCGAFHAARSELLFRRPAHSAPSPATLSL